MPADLWRTQASDRYFLIPDHQGSSGGSLELRSLSGAVMNTSNEAATPYEITEEQARRWAKDQLGRNSTS